MMRILLNNTNHVIAVFKYGDKSATVEALKIDDERIVKLVTASGKKYSIDEVEHFLLNGVCKDKDEAYEILTGFFTEKVF